MHAIYNFVQNSSGTSYTLLLCSPSPLPLLCGSMLVVGELLVNPLPLRSIPNDTNKISLISSTVNCVMLVRGMLPHFTRERGPCARANSIVGAAQIRSP
jgi:hypothetical protein